MEVDSESTDHLTSDLDTDVPVQPLIPAAVMYLGCSSFLWEEANRLKRSYNLLLAERTSDPVCELNPCYHVNSGAAGGLCSSSPFHSQSGNKNVFWYQMSENNWWMMSAWINNIFILNSLWPEPLSLTLWPICCPHPSPPAQNCSGLRTCSDCLQRVECGWCGDPSNTGRGVCMEGSYRGPLKPTNARPGPRDRDRLRDKDMSVDQSLCSSDRGYNWAFIQCPGEW